jgi:hypothetical protein
VRDTHIVFPKPDDVESEVWSAWLAVRKSKKATAISELVIKGISREATKAGLSLNEAITKCVEKNWVSLDASWLNKGQPFNAKPSADPFEGAI